MDRSAVIFGNQIDDKVVRKAKRTKARYLKKFGDDSQSTYPLSLVNNDILNPFIGVKNIEISDAGEPFDLEKGILVGNIRMGYGHYRISMAIASAAKVLGFTPYWFDLNAYQQTTGGKVISHLNGLYSMGSRWSQKYPLFNKLYWEKLNSEGFRKITYNSVDQKVAELMAPVYKGLPKSMPFIATHTWPAQAAVHAGMEKVVNVVPDNWPMALHLAEGSIHAVQTPSCYQGYRSLRGMDGDKALKPMPKEAIADVGHFIDHELLQDLEGDCDKRLNRIKNGKPLRVLLTIGGAGAQFEIYKDIINQLLPKIIANEITLMVNVGDYKNVWKKLLTAIPELEMDAKSYGNNWRKTCQFAEQLLYDDLITGVHAFFHDDIYAAVYTSNLLMRGTDILVTKPSELSFYPVPKLMIKRVGGHEAYGALRASEIGDGTVECETVPAILQMLEMMLSDPDMLTMMCENIIKAHQQGIYNGAYRAVELAVKGQ